MTLVSRTTRSTWSSASTRTSSATPERCWSRLMQNASDGDHPRPTEQHIHDRLLTLGHHIYDERLPHDGIESRQLDRDHRVEDLLRHGDSLRHDCAPTVRARWARGRSPLRPPTKAPAP